MERKRWAWAARNKDRPADENPFLAAIKPNHENYGDPSESGEDLRARLENLEFGNFPGYFNYRKNATVPESKIGGDDNRHTDETTETTKNNSQETIREIKPHAVTKAETATATTSRNNYDESNQLSVRRLPLEAGLSDERLNLMKIEWFSGKDVLDIGCNRGHITYAIARLFSPKLILGIDIDLKMIQMANRDLHLHLEDGLLKRATELRRERAARLRLEGDRACGKYSEDQNHFPLSSYISHGPLATPSASNRVDTTTTTATTLTTKTTTSTIVSVQEDDNSAGREDGGKQEKRTEEQQPLKADKRRKGEVQKVEEFSSFPNNIVFVEHNYVLAKDELVEKQKAFFDTIVCLSVTKWIHLNYRDEGIKRFFKRIYKHLKPEGLLILEVQPFDNYGRRKKLSDRLRTNYYSIRFKPEQFDDYLLGEEVGFRKILHSTTTDHECAGFKRPLKVFLK